MRGILVSLLSVAICGTIVPAHAQQFNLYEGAGNPYLLLLREPAVWDDLKLSTKQRDELKTLNARIDGPFLSLRNWSRDEANKKFLELVEETKSGAGQILSREQQQRLQQIMLRVRGIECVAEEQVAKAISLTDTQLESIRKTIQETVTALNELREQAQAGKPREPLQQEYTRRQTDEQKRILAELTPKQREQLRALVGRNFDPTKLGSVSFKAPELVAGGEWINSPPLTMKQLRGQVVAIHIWTFG